MAGRLLKMLGELFLPEKYGNDQIAPKEPIEALIAAYNQLLQLAAQVESHAEAAPYPQVTRRLSKIARENRESAEQLKKVIESHRGSVHQSAPSPASGKNHWERVKRDLADQRAFENFLAVCEPRLSSAFPELADVLFNLRSIQATHRETLSELMALADPQATQT